MQNRFPGVFQSKVIAADPNQARRSFVTQPISNYSSQGFPSDRALIVLIAAAGDGGKGKGGRRQGGDEQRGGGAVGRGEKYLATIGDGEGRRRMRSGNGGGIGRRPASSGAGEEEMRRVHVKSLQM